MRVTAPSLRRRNHAWRQMRALEKRGFRVRRHGDEDHANDEDDADHDDHSEDSDSASSDEESDFEDEPSTTIMLSSTSTIFATVPVRTGSLGAVILPTIPAAAPTTPGVALGAEEPNEIGIDDPETDSDSDDETTTLPPNITQSPPQPSFLPSPPDVTGSPSESISTTSLAGSESTSTPALTETPPTATASSSLPAGGNIGTGSEASPSQTPGTLPGPDLSAGVDVGAEVKDDKLSGGAVAGIVLGVLLSLGLIAGALFFWCKRRRDKGLPFIPFGWGSLGSRSSTPDITAPLPGKIGGPNHAKTNTQIMDELIRAAYASESGGNVIADEAAGYYDYNEKKRMDSQQPPHLSLNLPTAPQSANDNGNPFLDEQTYIALAGRLTPQPPQQARTQSVATEDKPVMQWLEEVRPPTQVGIPPASPSVPPSATLPRPVAGNGSGATRIVEPPQPAYFGRYTMTTESSGARWG